MQHTCKRKNFVNLIKSKFVQMQCHGEESDYVVHLLLQRKAHHQQFSFLFLFKEFH